MNAELNKYKRATKMKAQGTDPVVDSVSFCGADNNNSTKAHSADIDVTWTKTRSTNYTILVVSHLSGIPPYIGPRVSWVSPTFCVPKTARKKVRAVLVPNSCIRQLNQIHGYIRWCERIQYYNLNFLFLNTCSWVRPNTRSLLPVITWLFQIGATNSRSNEIQYTTRT